MLAYSGVNIGYTIKIWGSVPQENAGYFALILSNILAARNPTYYIGWCLFVCLSFHQAKTTEPIQMKFGTKMV